MVSLGDNIAGYTLLRRIGRGGMGEIFVARHRVLGRLVAIKVLLPEVLGVQALVERFLDEARAAAAIQVEAIAEVFDCGYLVDGRVYIVMELLQGANLREALRMEPSMRADLRFAAAVIGEVALGLHAGHIRDIVHRDVKPENIFLALKHSDAKNFRVKILDYGIAKLMRPEHFGTLTRTGGVLGTPRYMSPEQCRGERDIDPRSDVYSLGCVAFELLSGQAMFQADTIGGLLIAQATVVPPPLEQTVAGVPALLARLVDRMLEKDRQRRPQSMAEVVATIALFLGCEPGSFARFLRAPAHFLQQTVDVRDSQDRVSSVPGTLPRQASPLGDAVPGDDMEDQTRQSYRSLSLSSPDLAISHADMRVSGVGMEARAPFFSPAGRFPGKWWPAVAAAAFLSAVLLGFLIRKGGQESPRPEPAAASEQVVVVEAAQRRQPTSAGTEGSASAFVELTSVPSGAEVWLENDVEPRGKTPMNLRLPLSAMPLLATLRAKGYEVHKVELQRFERSAVFAELHALPAPRSRGTRPQVAEKRRVSQAVGATPAPIAPVAGSPDGSEGDGGGAAEDAGRVALDGLLVNSSPALTTEDGDALPDLGAASPTPEPSGDDPYEKARSPAGTTARREPVDPYEKVDSAKSADDPYLAAPDAVDDKFTYHKASD